MWPGPTYRALLTSTSIRPHRSSTAPTSEVNEVRSNRSDGRARTVPPAASMAAAVVARDPGSGLVSEVATVEECSRLSPSRRLRAVIATRWPEAARARATALPMPRLAPVTRATGASPGSVMDSFSTLVATSSLP